MKAKQYRRIYKWVHANTKNYGAHHGQNALVAVAGLLGRRDVLVDVGCGDNSFCRDMRILKPQARYYGVDVVKRTPVPRGVYFISAPAWYLSDIKEDIRVLTSFDVLEHLEARDVDKALKEWARVLNGFLVVSVSSNPSKIKGPGGEGLHLTIQPKQWWVEKIGEHFDNVSLMPGGYITGSKGAK
jgi:ubiquinone/menaquinone biosynthesis C-methylase UbiE